MENREQERWVGIRFVSSSRNGFEDNPKNNLQDALASFNMILKILCHKVCASTGGRDKKVCCLSEDFFIAFFDLYGTQDGVFRGLATGWCELYANDSVNRRKINTLARQTFPKRFRDVQYLFGIFIQRIKNISPGHFVTGPVELSK